MDSDIKLRTRVHYCAVLPRSFLTMSTRVTNYRYRAGSVLFDLFFGLLILDNFVDRTMGKARIK